MVLVENSCVTGSEPVSLKRKRMTFVYGGRASVLLRKPENENVKTKPEGTFLTVKELVRIKVKEK